MEGTPTRHAGRGIEMIATLLPFADIQPTLAQILEGTRHGRVRWTAENDRVIAEFPAAKLNLEPSDATRTGFRISLVSPSEATIWAATTDPSDPLTHTLQEMYQLAMRAAVSAVLKRIQEDLCATDEDSADTMTSTTPPPARPSSDAAFRFFEFIKGRWQLEFFRRSGDVRGQEEVEIDSTGNLFRVPSDKGRALSRDVRPSFRLELLESDDDLTRVEIAKVDPTGRIRQIEVLNVSSAQMEGFAKHDGHRVLYSRKE
jgi:hypothetical protein